MMSRRTSAWVEGRPGFWASWVQWLAMRRRCQRSKVSGVTSQPWRRRRGSAWAIAASIDRSSSLRSGRLFCLCKTPSWWRRTTISRSLERPVRTARRANDVRKRYKVRYTRSGSAGICPVQQPRSSFGDPQEYGATLCKRSAPTSPTASSTRQRHRSEYGSVRGSATIACACWVS